MATPCTATAYTALTQEGCYFSPLQQQRYGPHCNHRNTEPKPPFRGGKHQQEKLWQTEEDFCCWCPLHTASTTQPSSRLSGPKSAASGKERSAHLDMLKERVTNPQIPKGKCRDKGKPPLAPPGHSRTPHKLQRCPGCELTCRMASAPCGSTVSSAKWTPNSATQNKCLCQNFHSHTEKLTKIFGGSHNTNGVTHLWEGEDNSSAELLK